MEYANMAGASFCHKYLVNTQQEHGQKGFYSIMKSIYNTQ